MVSLSSTHDHMWSPKEGVSGKTICIGSFHASFHNFHNVSMYVKQKLVMTIFKL